MRIKLTGSPKRGPSYVATGRIWPSGDFSYGWRKVEGDSRVDYSSHLARVDRGEMSASAGPAWTVGPWGFPVVDESAIDCQGHAEALSVAEETAGAAWYCA